MSRIVDIEKLLKEHEDYAFFTGYPKYDEGFNNGVAHMVDKLEDLPIIKDIIKPVKCKNCHWYTPYEKPVEDFDGFCGAWERETDEEEFCSYGSNGT